MHLSKPTLTLLLLGTSGILVGFTFKLNHLMGAEQVFNAGVFGVLRVPGDLDNDGAVTTSDLLAFLAVFGQTL